MTDEALDAFWEVIVKRYPQAKTGDLSPGATIALQLAAEDAVGEWVEGLPCWQKTWVGEGFVTSKAAAQ